MSDKHITIASYPLSKAQALRRRLAEEGIRCHLSFVSTIRPAYPGGVKVRVRQEDLSRALEIFSEMQELFTYGPFDKEEITRDVDKILVPVDFSACSEKAALYALGLAARLHAEVHFFHAYYYPVMSSVSYANSYVFPVEDISLEEIRANAEHNMTLFTDRVTGFAGHEHLKAVHTRTTVLRGEIVDEILEMIEIYKPGAVIMGARGQGNNTTDIMGAVATGIVLNSPVPVIAIPETYKDRPSGRLNVLFATNLEANDLPAIRKLMALIYLFEFRLYVVHIDKSPDDPVVATQMKMLRKHIETHYPGFDIEYSILKGSEVESCLNEFIEENGVDLIALITHKRSLINRMLHPSLTGKMIFESTVPLLVFHA